MSDHNHELDEGVFAIATTAGLALALADRFFFATGWGAAGALILSYAAGALPPAQRALVALFTRFKLDIDLLMVTAALAAAAVGAPLEGAVLLTLFSISGALEGRAMGKARRAVEALMALRPAEATRIVAGKTEVVPVGDLVPGDRVVLQPGSRVPVDGVLIDGAGSVDESTITGESLPVEKVPGAALHEATVNLNAILVMEVRRRLEESTVAQMVRMVTEAQAMRAPSERFSDWFGQRYTWAVLLGSVLAFVVFSWMGQTMQDALYRAATLLVAASPCAIVISVPSAILSALSSAAHGGVLFKGGAALERLAEVRTFAFDKTGTLTTGKAVVTGIVALDATEDDLLRLAAGIELHSEHPIAAAIRASALERGLQPMPVTDVVSRASEGISGGLDGLEVWAGNARMAAAQGVDLDDPALDHVKTAAQTVVYIGRGGRLSGAIAVADEPRESSSRGLRALQAQGIARVAMMTGDRAAVAARIAESLGIAEVHADLLPGDKVDLVDRMAREGPVAFVGDGVNDAAALARADVGIAMGVAGSEVALQAADVALLSEDMGRLAQAYRLARRTRRVIRQNLAFAMVAMALLVTGGLFFDLPLPLAVLGHEGGTLLVVLNGLRLLSDPIRKPS